VIVARSMRSADGCQMIGGAFTSAALPVPAAARAVGLTTMQQPSIARVADACRPTWARPGLASSP
jgi:hypothetical protein